MKTQFIFLPIQRFVVLMMTISSLINLSSCKDSEDSVRAPQVTTISPTSGAPDSEFIISGNFFSTVLSENKVTFNGKDAHVKEGTATSLSVIVPFEATTGPVVVLVNGKPAI